MVRETWDQGKGEKGRIRGMQGGMGVRERGKGVEREREDGGEEEMGLR